MSILSRILIALLVVVVLAVASLAVALSHNSPCGPSPTTVRVAAGEGRGLPLLRLRGCRPDREHRQTGSRVPMACWCVSTPHRSIRWTGTFCAASPTSCA